MAYRPLLSMWKTTNTLENGLLRTSTASPALTHVDYNPGNPVLFMDESYTRLYRTILVGFNT